MPAAPAPPPFDLHGHTALVTGANSGIGAATAVTLAACGAKVAVAYLRLDDPPDPGTPDAYRQGRASDGESVASGIRRRGGDAIAIEADLTDASAPARLFDAAEQALGPVDILINNASGWVADTFVDRPVDRVGRRLTAISAATIDRQFGVDARGAALLIRELVRRHQSRGAGWGRIVGLTSGGPQGFPEEVSYGAAKAALENYTMSAATELAPLGITANIVYPPVTDTGWVTDAVRRFVADSPLHVHIAQPEEVARVIAYLASDEARLVTGTIMRLR